MRHQAGGRSAPRVCLTDTGLLAYLAGLTDARLAEHAAATGPLLENFVAMELIKQLSWSNVRASLYHFRSHSGEEVDLILEADDGRLVGIEVKASSTLNTRDAKGLENLRSIAGRRFQCGLILYTGREALAFGRDLWALPVATLWRLDARRSRK